MSARSIAAAAAVPGPRRASEPKRKPTTPSWQTRPCPPWCDTEHHAGDFYEDRTHFATVGGVIALSMYTERIDVDDADPGRLDVALFQHYHNAEPQIDLTMPEHRLGGHDVTGEADLSLTVDEARALRDALSAALAMVAGTEDGQS